MGHLSEQIIILRRAHRYFTASISATSVKYRATSGHQKVKMPKICRTNDQTPDLGAFNLKSQISLSTLSFKEVVPHPRSYPKHRF